MPEAVGCFGPAGNQDGKSGRVTEAPARGAAPLIGKAQAAERQGNTGADAAWDSVDGAIGSRGEFERRAHPPRCVHDAFGGEIDADAKRCRRDEEANLAVVEGALDDRAQFGAEVRVMKRDAVRERFGQPCRGASAFGGARERSHRDAGGGLSGVHGRDETGKPARGEARRDEEDGAAAVSGQPCRGRCEGERWIGTGDANFAGGVGGALKERVECFRRCKRGLAFPACGVPEAENAGGEVEHAFVQRTGAVGRMQALGTEPLGEAFCAGERRRERDQLHGIGRADDLRQEQVERSAAVGIDEGLDFIDRDGADGGEDIRVGGERGTELFIDGDEQVETPGVKRGVVFGTVGRGTEDPEARIAESAFEIGELLCGKGARGRQEDGPAAGCERADERNLRDESLARAAGREDEEVAPVEESRFAHGAALEGQEAIDAAAAPEGTRGPRQGREVVVKRSVHGWGTRQADGGHERGGRSAGAGVREYEINTKTDRVCKAPFTVARSGMAIAKVPRSGGSSREALPTLIAQK
jgi:hypothetical protein